MTFIIYLCFCLCFASFLSAYLYRYPLMAEHEWRKEAHDILNIEFNEPSPPSIYKGRSFCPECKHTLSIIDLIPILSYVFLLGKCRYCRQKINPLYILIEIIITLICVPLYFIIEDNYQLFLITGIFMTLLYISFFDHKNKWIPDELNLILILLSYIHLILLNLDLTPHVLGMIIGYSIIFLLRWLFIYVKNIEAIGLGDAKLLSAISTWFGFVSIPYILLLASSLGIFYYIVRRNTTIIAFGPFLSISAIIYYWVSYLYVK